MILCFDIGGTTMKGGRARAVDDIEVLERVPTPARDFDAFAGVLARAIADCPEPPRALAAAIPGVIEPGSGLGVVANIPCITGIPVRERLEAALGLPVILANDADCFALAEMAAGRRARASRGLRHHPRHRRRRRARRSTGGSSTPRAASPASGGTGRWRRGSPARRRWRSRRFACGCGLAGCLDATVSARGMERLHRHLHGVEATSLAIVAGWEAAEAEAARTVAVWLEIAAAPLAMLVNATAADILPVGGGLGGSATARSRRSTRRCGG